MIAENIKLLQEQIEKKCREVNRDYNEIKLIAVSKTFGVDEIQKAYDEGLRDFGENKAQELSAKYEGIGGKITWHFIGHLQRNKVKFVVPAADYIHSVDSLQLVSEINKYAAKINKIQKILIQVKTSYEESKSGIENKDELIDIVNHCYKLSNVEMIGLMTIAPFTEDRNIIRQSFIQLRKLRDDLKSNGFKVNELSMGMTSDFEIAIEEGATMLRIGSAIFGERVRQQPDSKEWKES
ncbi:MAG TPA: YggS family pyridoxal phosphate-dependent enzyme [Ignavibacteriaceae bacterium]|nr:YggS family pyridoxal phosphate-dependent enzyme [Ignavibacteriaceae bacterium]